MEAMRQQNEKTIAAGNMGVNAKGDVIKGGKVVKTAKARVTPSYAKTTQVAKTSLKKPLTQTDEKVEPKPDKETGSIDDTQMTTETVKTREDGSAYSEVMTPEGDIEIKEVSPKKKASKKKAKSSKKKPTI